MRTVQRVRSAFGEDRSEPGGGRNGWRADDGGQNGAARQSRPLLTDAAVAAVALVAALALAAGASAGQPGTRAMDGWAYPLVVAAYAALVARRRWPLPVAGVVGGTLLVFAVRAYPGGPLVVAVMVALYTLGVSLTRSQALVAGALAAVLVAARSVIAVTAHGQVSAFSWAAPGWVMVCLLAGMVMRGRRLAMDALRDRAWQAERGREETARARAAEERLRIARDLHDVVGHSFAAVNVQARAAVALMDAADLVAARQALVAIDAASRDALREIRAVLGTIRSDDTGPAATRGTGQLPELLAPVRAAGLAVHAVIEELRLPPIVDEAVYRLVQESLTNVLRHAHASTVAVTLVRDGGRVSVEVRDDGVGGTDGGQGHGIAGMRERVGMVGGSCVAGPAGDGGWRVAASIPVQG